MNDGNDDSLLRLRYMQYLQRQMLLSRYYALSRKYAGCGSSSHTVILETETQRCAVQVPHKGTVEIPSSLRRYEEGENDRILEIVGWNSPLTDITEDQVIKAVMAEVEDVSKLEVQKDSVFLGELETDRMIV